MIPLDHLFERFDLISIHVALSGFGAILSIYLMQVSWHDGAELGDPMSLRVLRRISLMMISYCFAWMFYYALEKGWQPWPPLVVMEASLVFSFVVRIITIGYREHVRRGHGRKAPIPVPTILASIVRPERAPLRPL